MSIWFGRWADFAVRRRFWVLAATLLVTFALAREAKRHLILDTRWEHMYSAEQLEVLAHVRKNFDADDMFMLLVHGDVFSPDYLERLTKLHRRLEHLDLVLPSSDVASGKPQQKQAGPAADDFFAGFDSPETRDETEAGSIFEQIISLVNVRRTVWQDGALRVGGMMDGYRAGSEARLRELALGEGGTAVKLVSDKADYSLILLRTGFIDQNDTTKVYHALSELSREVDAPGFKISLAGGATFRTVLAEIMASGSRRFSALALLLMAVLLALIFRHPLGVIAPLLVVAASVGWTLGAMALWGIDLTTQTLVLPQLLICIGITDAIHVQSVYAGARARGLDNAAAIAYAIEKNATPVLLATTTTAAGLLSFLASGIRPVWELGVFGALGVMFALVLTNLLLPPLLSFNRKSLFGARLTERPPDLLDRSLAALGRVAQGTQGRRAVLASIVVAAAVALLGLSKLEVGLFPLGWFPKQDPMRQTFGTIDDSLGGSNELRILIEPTQGDMRDQKLLVALDQLERDIASYRDPELGVPLAADLVSVLDLVRESWRAFHDGDPKFYAIPPDQQGVVDMFTFLQNGAQKDLKHLITLNADSAILNVRVRWVESPKYLAFAEYIQQRADRLLQKRAKLTFTGPSYNIALVGMQLVGGLTQSFGVAFLLVGALIVFQCGSLRLGVIAMIPNALALSCILATFGLLGIPLDAANVTFASIALGILDDDAIHFIHHVSDARRDGESLLSAIQSGYVLAGRAMVSASVVVGLGFALRLFEYMRQSQDFGLLMSLSCSLGLAANLLYVPVLLRTFGPGRAQAAAAPSVAG
jgi:predicted RND superfamily exporter protein